jgi:hypothetical protein
LLVAGLVELPGGVFPVEASPAAVSGLFGFVTPGSISPSVVGPITAFGDLPPGVGPSHGGVATNPNGGNSLGFDATTGNGQMTLTTGANTLGISSFAMPAKAISDKIGAS